jgi:hypothetical protein
MPERVKHEQCEPRPERDDRDGQRRIAGEARAGRARPSVVDATKAAYGRISAIQRSTNALACGARVVGVDREDLGPLEHRREAGLERHVGMCWHEVDLVLGELVLHCGRGSPVDQFLAELGILGALDERDALSGSADALLGKADGDLVALRLGVERVDDEEDAAARLSEPTGSVPPPPLLV